MHVTFRPWPVILALSLLVAEAAAQTARLANISTRGQVGEGADSLFGVLPNIGRFAKPNLGFMG